MSNSFTTYDISNFIIDYCNKKYVNINNMKLNGLLSYLYYDSIEKLGYPIINEKPVRNKSFYVVESAYNRFRHMGAENVKFIPNDFDFMSLLEEGNWRLQSQPSRLSEDLIEQMNVVKKSTGNYIEKHIESLKNISIFDFAETLDKKIVLYNN